MPLLNWRMWAALAIALVLAASHWKAYRMGEASIQADWTAEKLAIEKNKAKLVEANIARTNDLQAKADTIKRTKDAEIERLRDHLDAALISLRNRPERPTDLPTPTGSEPSCTGRSLFHSDADFLVREAARADDQRLQLTECQAAYSAARKAINKD